MPFESLHCCEYAKKVRRASFVKGPPYVRLLLCRRVWVGEKLLFFDFVDYVVQLALFDHESFFQIIEKILQFLHRAEEDTPHWSAEWHSFEPLRLRHWSF